MDGDDGLRGSPERMWVSSCLSGSLNSHGLLGLGLTRQGRERDGAQPGCAVKPWKVWPRARRRERRGKPWSIYIEIGVERVYGYGGDGDMGKRARDV